VDAWVEAADPPTLETEDVDVRVARDIEEFVPAVTVLFENPAKALVVVALPPTIVDVVVADDIDAVVLAEVCTGADGRIKVLRPAACSMDMICGNMVASTPGIPKI